MSSSTLTRAIVIGFVIILAVIIIYPKIMDTGTEPVRISDSATTGQTPITAAQSPGETALSSAIKSGKPTMILFHATT